jgi:hypothetical protein
MLGVPGVGATEKGSGREGGLRLVFASGSEARQVGVDASGAVTPPVTPPGPDAKPGAEAVATLGFEGAGVSAYAALDAQGRPVTAVRQELASGAAQAGLLAGTGGGPVSELSAGPSGGGDALIGFRQGEAGRYEIVAERVSAPPASLEAKAPKGWVRPGRARLRWQAAKSAVGGLVYSVLLDGRIVKGGLRRHSFLLPRAQLGNGVRRAQAMATDRLGQQVLSAAVKLRVDGRPPRVTVRAKRAGGLVVVRLSDPDSGLSAASTSVSFGDGTHARGGARFHHAYERRGRYTIAVRGLDEVGNRVARRFGVVVG